VQLGARGSLVVKALGYKPEGRRFENRWGGILNLRNPSSSGVYSASNRNEYWKHEKKIMFLVSKVQPVYGGYNLTAIYEPIV
jgi:hypothetical protein